MQWFRAPALHNLVQGRWGQKRGGLSIDEIMPSKEGSLSYQEEDIRSQRYRMEIVTPPPTPTVRIKYLQPSHTIRPPSLGICSHLDGSALSEPEPGH